MTAEVAILNLEAVALAADSAVTIRGEDGAAKIFNSANKLFALSDSAPVGILVYDNASFLSIPWETVIKEYRSKRGRKTFGALGDYVNDFKAFLSDELPTYHNVLFVEGESGVAIAGFGDQELLPSLVELSVISNSSGIEIQNEVLASVHPEWPQSFIIPLAQRDMMELFVEGLASEYSNYIPIALEVMLEENSSMIINALTELVPSLNADKVQETIRRSNAQLVSSFSDGIAEVTQKFFVSPTMDAVTMLPKEQLADMAEALVNLTSLKRRVSPGEETVGGATDVALITKGDGLVWMKRKHYFPAEFNHAYFARMYGRISYGTSITQDKG